MLPLSKSGKVFTSLGINVALLSNYGNYLECHLLMSLLSQDIRKHWIEWEDEFRQAMDVNRQMVSLIKFDQDARESLLSSEKNHFKYRYLDLIININ